MIHADGTGRIQIVRAEDDPLTYAYLKALGRRIGVEMSVNTSFNVAGPIAQTPKQAIETLRRSKGLDVVLLVADDGTVHAAWHGGERDSGRFTAWLSRGNRHSNAEFSTRVDQGALARGLAYFGRETISIILAFVVIGRVGPGAIIGLDRSAAHDGHVGQQALGERDGIGGILVPQRCGEGRAGKIPRGHAPGMTDHLRARGNAGLDRFQHQLHVEAGLLGDRKPLGDAGDLDRAHQIVDQLVDRAGADGAEMTDGG